MTLAEHEKLKRLNRALIRKNKDLEAQNDELEDRLATMGLNSNTGKVEVLEGELERLRKEVRDQSREPVYADVVREGTSNPQHGECRAEEPAAMIAELYVGQSSRL